MPAISVTEYSKSTAYNASSCPVSNDDFIVDPKILEEINLYP